MKRILAAALSLALLVSLAACGGKSTDQYRVDTVENGKVVSTSNCTMISNQNYFQINLDPPTGSGCTYSPNDCSVGDVDGDGMYEIFMKWDPPNSKDNSQKGKTGNEIAVLVHSEIVLSGIENVPLVFS